MKMKISEANAPSAAAMVSYTIARTRMDASILNADVTFASSSARFVAKDRATEKLRSIAFKQNRTKNSPFSQKFGLQ